MLTGTSRSQHITPILRELQWLSIPFNAQFKLQALPCKALHSLGPGSSSPPMPSAAEALLYALPASKAWLVGMTGTEVLVVVPLN